MSAKKIIQPFIFLLSLLGVTNTFSQTKEIDSLKLVLANSKEDSNKVNTLAIISNKLYDNYDYNSSNKYVDLNLALTKKLKLKVKEFDAFILLGKINWMQSKSSEQLEAASTALSLSKEVGDKKMMAEAYIAMTYAYQNKENLSEAIKNAFNALRLYDEIGEKYNIADTWLAIGRAYSRQRNYKEMSSSCRKALQLFKEDSENNKNEIGRCYHYTGRAEMLMGNYNMAMLFFDSALRIWHQTGEKTFLAGTTMHIGLVYKGMGDSTRATGNEILAVKFYEQALIKYTDGRNIVLGFGDSSASALTKQMFGDIYLRLNKFTLARNCLEEALGLAANEKSKDIFLQTYQSLFKLDSTEGNYKLAFEHLKLYNTYKDSINIEESLNNAEGHKMQYDFDKKEDSLKQKQLITETKLKAEKKQKYFYWTGLALLALLSFFIFLNFRNQKKINRLAAEAYANERTELELQSLRAQLNPHFIFNCINSIDAFIHSNDKYNATVYLNKFARLLRNILDSSKLTTVALAKDIDTLKLYVELEELRHENKFRSVFKIQDELLSNDYKVPALIIQPFVENAILHGLKNREDNDGLLQIEIRKNADKIEYRIKDNGIGRKAAGLITQNKESSYGMQMSYDRIKLFNKEEKPSVQIVDLYTDGIAAGTEVKVRLNIV